jgi:hypothetical protein
VNELSPQVNKLSLILGQVGLNCQLSTSSRVLDKVKVIIVIVK